MCSQQTAEGTSRLHEYLRTGGMIIVFTEASGRRHTTVARCGTVAQGSVTRPDTSVLQNNSLCVSGKDPSSGSLSVWALVQDERLSCAQL